MYFISKYKLDIVTKSRVFWSPNHTSFCICIQQNSYIVFRQIIFQQLFLKTFLKRYCNIHFSSLFYWKAQRLGRLYHIFVFYMVEYSVVLYNALFITAHWETKGANKFISYTSWFNIFVYFPLHFRTPVFQHGASLVLIIFQNKVILKYIRRSPRQDFIHKAEDITFIDVRYFQYAQMHMQLVCRCHSTKSQ